MANFRRLRAWCGSFAAVTARGLIALGGHWWTAFGLPPLETPCAGACGAPGCEQCRGRAVPARTPRLDRPPAGHPERLCQDQPLTAHELVLWQGILGK